MADPDGGGRRARSMKRWIAARTWALPVLFLLAVTLPHLDDGDWQRTDSGWYGAIAVQAWRTGEFLTLWGEPGQPYFNKPPLVFWIQGLPMWAFGPSAWSARLPTVLAAAGCVLLTVSIARQGMSRRGAMWCGIALALTYEFFRRTREISLDMWQALFLLAALRLAVGAVVSGRSRWLVLAGVPVGLALLCKPLIGVLVYPMFAAMLVLGGRARMLPWLVLSVLVAAAVAAPWHLAMVAEHGDEFVRQYFGAEIGARAAGEGVGRAPGGVRWWFYFEKIALGYWPWLAAIIAGAIGRARGRRIGVDRRVMAAAMVWTVGWLLLLTAFPDRRDRYGVVLYPGLALLAGAWLGHGAMPAVRGLLRVLERRGWWVVTAAAIVFAALPVRVQRPVDPQWPALFEFLEAGGSPELWQGAMIGHRGSRIYNETGRWPITTRDRWGNFTASPPPGAWIVYHADDGLLPGPGEEVVFTNGKLAVTRLGPDATWSPRTP